MPTFSQNPFSMSEKAPLPPMPPGTHPLVAKALVLYYEDIVRKAEDMATVILMEMNSDGIEAPDLTEDEIESFHLGAVMATTAIAEIMEQHQLLDIPSWGRYVGKLLKDGGVL